MQLGRGSVVTLTACFQAANILVTAELFQKGFRSPIQLNYLCIYWYIFLGAPRAWQIFRSSHAEFLEEPRELPARKWYSSYSGTLALCGSQVFTEIMILVALFVLFVIANSCFIIALSRMSAGIVTSIFATCPVFVCALSILFLGRKPSSWEAAAVLCSIGGMLCISRPWLGDKIDATATICALASPMAAALYNILFSRVFSNAGWREVGWILAKLVILNATLGTAFVGTVVSIPHPLEPAVWTYSAARTPEVIMVILASGATGLGFNFYINYAVTITYPLFVSVGSVLSTLIVLAASAVFHDQWPVNEQWAGIALVGVGFAILV